jgi:DNA modification methylase
VSVTILHGDCRDVLAALPAASVQCCVTSPPYYGLRDYGVDGQIGLEPTPDEYVAQMVAVFREVRRVLRDDGTLWLNIGDSYAGSDASGFRAGNPEKNGGNSNRNVVGRVYGAKPKDLLGIPWLLAFALRADGWFLRSEIIWHKPNPMPESVRDRPTKAHETVFLLSKAARYYYDADAIAEPAEFQVPADRAPSGDYSDGSGRQDGGQHRSGGFVTGATRNARSVWTIATQPYSGAHFATMPPDLAERCIKAGTSERGQCPHCGTPWGRVVERVDTGRTQKAADGWDVGAGGHGTIHREGRSKGAAGAPVLANLTTGWAPSCACPAHDPVPQTVLDPFGGAGTTGLVADRLQRHALLIELNATYASLARDRIHGDAPLLLSPHA